MTARRSLPLLVALLFAVASLHADAADSAEANVLLKFKKMIADPEGKLGSWVAGTNPCADGKGKGEWNGVICGDGNVHGLQLENMGLSGMLNVSVGALMELPDLRTLSFKDSQFYGPMPDMKNFAGMRNIFLSNNKLSGEILDDAFQGMGSLKKVDLSRNEFFGAIPTSLARVPKLLQLRLDDNNFSGTIPDLRQKGVARAMAYLYEELPMLGVPHGHLKSSNVLLGESLEPLLTDYALMPVMNQSHAAQLMVACKSPERKQIGRTSKKSDVWSLGMLILEILTGKVPMHDTQQGKESTDLVDWVNSAAGEERAGQVLDSKMSRTGNAEGEMLKLLQIALACCEERVGKRWEMKKAVEKIEEMTEGNGDNSSTASEVEASSSKAAAENDFSSIAIN